MIRFCVSGLMQEGRSFIYNRKSRGPRIDPCGTPDVTGSQCEVVLSHVARWCLSVR